MSADPETFYKTFSEENVSSYGSGRRDKIERHRLELLHRFARPPGAMFEIGPGHGGHADLAAKAGWNYTAVEASPILAQVLRDKGHNVIEGFVPPMPIANQSADVLYADQVLEHMSGIDAARQFVAEARRVLRPGGVMFVVVPDYLKERTFFWDVDYTHNFVTTERRMKQLFNDGGFEFLYVERCIGTSSGFGRDLLAAVALVFNLPGMNTLFRRLGQDEFLYKVRKTLFELLTIVVRRP
jgi:SAM-dependent methyltransferase